MLKTYGKKYEATIKRRLPAKNRASPPSKKQQRGGKTLYLRKKESPIENSREKC